MISKTSDYRVAAFVGAGMFLFCAFAAVEEQYVIAAGNLGDCESAAYSPEVGKECGNYIFCRNAGCTATTDYGGDSCKPGFAIVAIDVAAADRIQVGSCDTASGQACPYCPTNIYCAKGSAWGSANCSNNDCGQTIYRVIGPGRCI